MSLTLPIKDTEGESPDYITGMEYFGDYIFLDLNWLLSMNIPVT